MRNVGLGCCWLGFGKFFVGDVRCEVWGGMFLKGEDGRREEGAQSHE